MSESVDAVVVGAGVIGLAIACELQGAGHDVLLLEKNDRIGAETSSRNSEVIHAGLYYPAGSLKARFCVEGRRLLYEFCEAFRVPHERIGKLIVATSEEERGKLRQIQALAEQNGVADLRIMRRGEVRREEPEVACVEALLSPSTGIIDSGALMLALLGEFERRGGAAALLTACVGGRVRDGELVVSTESGSDRLELACRTLINAAGHGAHAFAAALEGFPVSTLPPRYLAKGSYCAVSGRSPFRRLIYPVPVPGALGTHVTLDLQGGVRLGPDIAWVETLDYSVADDIAPRFAAAARKFWPAVDGRTVHPSYCGIRPKIHGPDQGFADFRIDGPERHGVSGLVNLFGVESPGLTSSLAIARHVAAMFRG
jgi:L-2-hydroxyglutarate oxidase LhgO